MDININIDGRSPAGQDARRRAVELLTAALRQDDPELLNGAMKRVLTEVAGSVEATAYVIAAAAQLGAVMANIIAIDQDLAAEQVVQVMAAHLERGDYGV